MSYWDRPFFPEWCSDGTLDDSETYDTMVRIAGNWAGFAEAFKVIMDMYGWTHMAVVSDDEIDTCWYGLKPFGAIFGSNKNYTLTWLGLREVPTDEELDDVLQRIRSQTRGYLLSHCITPSHENTIKDYSLVYRLDLLSKV